MRASIIRAVSPWLVKRSTSSQTSHYPPHSWSNYPDATHAWTLALAAFERLGTHCGSSGHRFRSSCLIDVQCKPYPLKSGSAATVGEEAVMPHAHQTFGKNMQQKPPYKLFAAHSSSCVLRNALTIKAR